MAGSGTLEFTTFVALGDVNLDGGLDLVATFIAGFVNDYVAVRLNLFTGFLRGDSNQDGTLNLADPIFVLDYLFGDTLLQCLDSGDMNDDGLLNVADPIYGLSYLFDGGRSPPPPLSGCDADPTSDELSCEAFSACP